MAHLDKPKKASSARIHLYRPAQRMDRNAIIAAIKKIADQQGLSRLTEREFVSSSGIAPHVIARHFDRWSDACRAAGIACETNDKIVPSFGPSRQECLDDILRVAGELGTLQLTRDAYKKHGRWPSLSPVYRHFGNWPTALDAAGLARPAAYREPVPFEVLAAEFIHVTAELDRLPTVRELKRRTGRKVERFASKHGGYDNFKVAIASWYFDDNRISDRPLSETAHAALKALHSPQMPAVLPDDPAPHRRGNILGFRQFAYAPTQEQDVVAIFNSVAHDLGFEIIAKRVRFPDCLARERQTGGRSHFLECKIEFEFKSSDYRAHGHPLNGCDLIVCWEHDWNACPMRVLELRSRIRQLDGWR